MNMPLCSRCKKNVAVIYITRLEDGKDVCFSTGDWYEMLRFYHFVLSDG